jgi:hypothetical protein
MIKKFSLCLLLFLIFRPEISLSQNFSWITPGKTYLKLYTVSEGLTRIGRPDFTNAGINTSTVDPRTIKLYNKGAQVPVYFSGESDGVFNDGDYFDFYALRNSGGLTKTYDQTNSVVYTTDEYFNQYSDSNIYWVEWSGPNGLRFSNSSFSVTAPFPQNFHFDKLHKEKDNIYSQGENNNINDLRFLNTEKFSGEGWYWTVLSNSQELSDTFSLPGLHNFPENADLRIFAYPLNRSTLADDHNLEIRVNGNIIKTITSNEFNKIDTVISFSSSLLSATSANNVTIKYIPVAGFDGYMLIDLFEITFPSSFKLINNKLTAGINSTDTTSKQFKVSGYNSLNSVNIYDVRNNIRISNFTSNADTLIFTAKSNSKISIVNDTVRLKPARIKQKSVPDLVSASNGADYLLIYHSLFNSQAEQLRSYRQTASNFRSVKADIEDIYDVFNYGIEDPLAVRYFVKHAHETWQLPKIKYVCLFGRGSLDPKKNSVNTVYDKNLVPVYGNPNSEGYFVNFNLGTFHYYYQIGLGRIPAYTVTEAQTMVDKIIAYESQTPEIWSKTFSFITGGSTINEQQAYQQRSNFEINQYVTNFPINGTGSKIYRSDNPGNTTFNYADSIKNSINRGTIFVNFKGHAGNHDWEVGMADPDVLSNGNKLPLVLSLTCFTGEFAKAEFRGFGEKFMYLSGKGSIGFVSTTGWSYATHGNDFGTFILQSIKNDSNRRLGDLIKVPSNFMSGDSLNPAVRHTINCYHLLGDPAAKLNLPRAPEFAITNEDYKLSAESILPNEPVSLRITPKNYGLNADTCLIRYQLKKNNSAYLTKDTLYRNFKFLDTLFHSFRLDSPGVYSMTVTLDANNRFPNEDESNNSITFNVPFKEYLYLPLSPANNSVVFKDSVEFTGLNPVVNLSTNSVKVILQSDTSKKFNSPVLQTFVNSSLSGVDTKFRSYLPVRNAKTIYYWRTNSIINNDSAGWTGIRSFVYTGNPLSLTKEPVKNRLVSANIYVDLYKFDRSQFPESDFHNTNFNNPEGIKLNERTENLYVKSYGNNAEEASFFNVGNKSIYIDGGRNAGLNMLKVKRLNGSILEFKNVRMTSAASSDSVVTFLNTFDSTYFLMLLNASYAPGGTMLSPSARAKIREFGSVYCDSIGLLAYFHTWSFIGYHGAPNSQVSEMFDPCCSGGINCTACNHWTPSTSSMDVTFRSTSGTVSNIIGPAKQWTDFQWGQHVPANSTLLFDVFGISETGNQHMIFQNLQTNEHVDLSKIDTREYPYLNIIAKLNIDTMSGTGSPVLKSLRAGYSPANELVLDRYSVNISSAQKDNSITSISFDYHNSGFAFIYGTIVNIYNGNPSDSNLILTDTVSALLKIDSTRSYSHSFTTPSFRDSARIFVSIKPRDLSPEFYTYNNSADIKLSSSIAAASNDLEVLSDGKQIISGDYVSKNPELKITLKKENAVFLMSDTTQLSIRLNNKYVPYYENSSLNPKLRALENDGQNSGEKISLQFSPQLETGRNSLAVMYRNEAGSMDTISYDINVSGESLVSELYNYPNPMKDRTDFIFNLSGQFSGYKFKIKIFTVGGRLIREFEYNASPGANSVPWDGRDNDGDFVANGTYFYKLIFDDDLNSDAIVQKLVVLR